MLVVPEQLHAQEAGLLKAQNVDKSDRRLPLVVVLKSGEATVLALKKAGILASRLHARVELIVTQIVPYPLPLDQPPVHPNLFLRRLCALARETPVETPSACFVPRSIGNPERGATATFSRRYRWSKKMVGDGGNEAGAQVASGRSRCDSHRNGVSSKGREESQPGLDSIGPIL
jgi:hypothetical protein